MKSKNTTKAAGQNTKGKRAVLYARKSFDESGISESVQAQIDACRAFAESQGYEVIGEFTDRASGRTPPTGHEEEFKDDTVTNDYCRKMKQKRRPGLGELAKLIESGKVDVVVCRDITRLARPRFRSRFINWSQTFFQDNAVKVHCYMGGLLDFSDKNTALVTFLQQAMVDDELEKRAKASKERKQALRQDGNYLSKAPFGYVLEGGKYSVDEDAAKIIREIFKLRLKGKSTSKIADTVNQKGWKTKEGKAFIPASVSAILRRPIYGGKIPTDSGGFADSVNVKPIVDPNDWLKCWYASEDSKKLSLSTRTHTTTSLMSRLLVCGYCGNLYTSYSISGARTEKYQDKTRLTRYDCIGRKNKRQKCENRGISRADVDAWFGEFCILKTAVENSMAKDNTEKIKKLPDINKQLKVLRSRLAAMMEDTSDLDLTTWKTSVKTLSMRIEELDRKRVDIETTPSYKQTRHGRILDAGKMEFEEKQQVIRMIFENVVMYREKFTVQFKTGKVVDVPFVFEQRGRVRRMPKISTFPGKGKIRVDIDGDGDTVETALALITFSHH